MYVELQPMLIVVHINAQYTIYNFFIHTLLYTIYYNINLVDEFTQADTILFAFVLIEYWVTLLF